ncbi:helix-turn-helix domain-containing protein [Streptomyces sp. CB01881]|uniref:helix-turn-helix domain-containing protein n=1 Tax=Streptomyces sp. CB01881 TaxID=2078691 RepID=UPI0013866937|nr:helix-turn-helix domain-containing protein [Streptomyces sp. CB01881]
MSSPVGRSGRAADILAMHHAGRKGGTPQVLRWLANRTGADVFLMNPSGTGARAGTFPSDDTARAACLRGAGDMAERGLQSAVIDQGELTCFILVLDNDRTLRAPLLTAVARRPAAPDLPVLLADAVSILGLTWHAEDARRSRQRLRTADTRTREAVLRLLMDGQTAIAQDVAGALRPTLPEVMQMYVVEGPHEARSELALRIAETNKDAWVVPCPVYNDHMLVLAPPPPCPTAALPVWATHGSTAERLRLGVSNPLHLRETATGYAQAFHALAAARHRTSRLSTFAGEPDLALTIGPAVAAWSDSFLSPVRSHLPRRTQDPDGPQLLATAGAWLRFSSGAATALNIHRNTLAARLAHVQELLRLDLTRLADQSALALALHAAAGRTASHRSDGGTGEGRPTPPPSLDELLVLPRVASWAHRQFRPLQDTGTPTPVAETIGTWLHLDAHIGHTAGALSLSESAVRKRLARAEVLLQRSLTRPPTVVHDLWLAQRALELTGR